MINKQYIEDWHMDLVVSWRKNEGLTLKECVARLNSNFPREGGLEYSFKAVEQRYYAIPKHVREGTEKINSFHQTEVEDVSELGLLEMLKAETFNRLKISTNKEEGDGYRKDADLLLRILRLKKDYTKGESDDARVKERESILALVREKQPTKEVN